MRPQRLLVVRIGAMGDVLHALPAVASLRQLWPEAQIDWAVDSRWSPLLIGTVGSGPVVSEVHLAETRSWSRSPFSITTVRSVSGLRRAVRAQPYDAVVDMQGTLRSAVIGSFARGSGLIGYADPREAPARLFYKREIQRRGTHVVDQGTGLLGAALGISLRPAVPDLPTDEVTEAWVTSLLGSTARPKRIALLVPTAGWGAKQWPAARFAELGRALEARQWTVLVNATEDAAAKLVLGNMQGVGQRVRSNLAQLIALIRRTDLVVGGDSGPVHLAAALGTPLVGLYGPTDPARNGPWGLGPKTVLRDAASTTSHKRVDNVDRGLERISVKQVLQTIDALTSP